MASLICVTDHPIPVAQPRLSRLPLRAHPSEGRPTDLHCPSRCLLDFGACCYSTERDSLREIHALSKTIGVKLLYSSDTSTSLKMIPEILGRTDTKFHDNEVTAGIPVFVCKVIGFTINNKPSKKYAITGKLTIIEEKVFPV